MWSKLKRLFLTGLLLILPIGLTVFLAVWLFQWLDNLLGRYILRFFDLYIPGAGILLGIIIIFTVGAFTSNIVGKKLSALIERIFSGMPIIKEIYSPIRDIVKNFTGGGSNSFRKVVKIDFPTNDSFSLGFLTNDHITIEGETQVAVFIPTTPNPTNGFLVFVKPEQIREVDMDVDDALKLIISMGTISPGMGQGKRKKANITEDLDDYLDRS